MTPKDPLGGCISDIYTENMWALPDDEEIKEAILSAIADHLGPETMEPVTRPTSPT
ncbi:hypothetical protein [Corynebacterium sp.]|uniref:hypothetical protein n=1 Tax=Corynebacterium sp. TaxID=1720 RepID=UPI0028AF58AD|nr:hypothetical protein [Corynebacterium sp.]